MAQLRADYPILSSEKGNSTIKLEIPFDSK